MQSRNQKEYLIVLIETYNVQSVTLLKARNQNGAIQKSLNHKWSYFSY